MLSTSAKYLKLLKVASAVIRLKSETTLVVNTRISHMTISLNIIIPLIQNGAYILVEVSIYIKHVNVSPVEILSKQPGKSKNDIKNADFRLNSTESSDYRRHFHSALMTKFTNKGTYHPFAPTLMSSH